MFFRIYLETTFDCILIIPCICSVYYQILMLTKSWGFPTGTRRNSNIIMTSKQRRDVMTALLLRRVSTGLKQGTSWFISVLVITATFNELYLILSDLGSHGEIVTWDQHAEVLRGVQWLSDQPPLSRHHRSGETGGLGGEDGAVCGMVSSH